VPVQPKREKLEHI